jgi:bifunctional non-homologous end joining protein LigD
MYVFQQLHPTPARGKFKEEMYEDPKWTAELKYDGDRRIAQFCPEGTRFTGRRVSDVDGLLVEKTDNLPQMNEPVESLIGCVLDGEIISPREGARSNAVTSVMGSLPARAAQLQAKNGFLEYRAFDILFHMGEDVRSKPLDERRAMLVDVLSEWNNKYVKQAIVRRDEKFTFLNMVWEAGGEGVIFKHVDSLYAEKNRWAKVKHELTEDVVIMGYEEPAALSEKVDGLKSITKYKANGWIGAITCGQYDATGELVEVASVSGMTDSMRAELSPRTVTHNGRPKRVDGGAKYIGHVIEIEANEREPSGRFRHPRFKMFRPDKNPRECVLPGVAS